MERKVILAAAERRNELQRNLYMKNFAQEGWWSMFLRRNDKKYTYSTLKRALEQFFNNTEERLYYQKAEEDIWVEVIKIIEGKEGKEFNQWRKDQIKIWKQAKRLQSVSISGRPVKRLKLNQGVQVIPPEPQPEQQIQEEEFFHQYVTQDQLDGRVGMGYRTEPIHQLRNEIRMNYPDLQGRINREGENNAIGIAYPEFDRNLIINIHPNDLIGNRYNPQIVEALQGTRLNTLRLDRVPNQLDRSKLGMDRIGQQIFQATGMNIDMFNLAMSRVVSWFDDKLISSYIRITTLINDFTAVFYERGGYILNRVFEAYSLNNILEGSLDEQEQHQKLGLESFCYKTAITTISQLNFAGDDINEFLMQMFFHKYSYRDFVLQQNNIIRGGKQQKMSSEVDNQLMGYARFRHYKDNPISEAQWSLDPGYKQRWFTVPSHLDVEQAVQRLTEEGTYLEILYHRNQTFGMLWRCLVIVKLLHFYLAQDIEQPKTFPIADLLFPTQLNDINSSIFKASGIPAEKMFLTSLSMFTKSLSDTILARNFLNNQNNVISMQNLIAVSRTQPGIRESHYKVDKFRLMLTVDLSEGNLMPLTGRDRADAIQKPLVDNLYVRECLRIVLEQGVERTMQSLGVNMDLYPTFLSQLRHIHSLGWKLYMAVKVKVLTIRQMMNVNVGERNNPERDTPLRNPDPYRKLYIPLFMNLDQGQEMARLGQLNLQNEWIWIMQRMTQHINDSLDEYDRSYINTEETEEWEETDLAVAFAISHIYMDVIKRPDQGQIPNKIQKYLFDPELIKNQKCYTELTSEEYRNFDQSTPENCKLKVAINLIGRIDGQQIYSHESYQNKITEIGILKYTMIVENNGIVECVKKYLRQKKSEQRVGIQFVNAEGQFIGEVISCRPPGVVKELYYVGINGNHSFVIENNLMEKQLKKNNFKAWKRMFIVPYKQPKRAAKNQEWDDINAVLLAYDFETTTMKNQEGKHVMQIFLASFWIVKQNMNKPFTLRIQPHEDQTYFRRKIVAYMEYIWKNEVGEEQPMYLMGFNSHRFDFQLIRNQFLRRFPHTQFYGHMQDFIFAQSQGNIYLVDVCKMLGGSGTLDKWSKTLLNDQKNRQDLKFINTIEEWHQLDAETKDKWQTYCEQDAHLVIGLYQKLMSSMCQIIKTAIPNVVNLSYSKIMGFSISSIAFKMFKKYFSESNLLGCNEPKVQNLYRNSYGGGLTIHFRNYEIKQDENMKLLYLDINSMYPWIMHSQEFPTKPGSLVKQNVSCGRFTYKDQIIPLNLYILNAYKFKEGAFIASFGIEVNGRKRYVRELREEDMKTTQVWGFQLISGFKTGQLLFINSPEQIIHNEVGRPFQNFVKTFYDLRMKAKRELKEDLDGLLKLVLNSVYGKFGQRLFDMIMYHIEEASVEFQEKFNKDPQSLLATMYHAKSGIYESHFACDQEFRAGSGSLTYLASAITAYGRNRIFEDSVRIENTGSKILYCDTDSLVIQQLKPLPDFLELHETNLGAYKIVYDNMKSFYAFAPKFYRLIKQDGTIIYKCKGINASAAILKADLKNLPENERKKEEMKIKDKFFEEIFIQSEISEMSHITIDQLRWSRDLKQPGIEQQKFLKTIKIQNNHYRIFQLNNSYLQQYI